MKIALIGANGQLGTDLCNVIAEKDLVKLSHKDIEICNLQNARSVLGEIKPSVIINTAAFHRVDDCEDLPEITFRTNVFGVKNLAVIANELAAKLIHFTSDYVFDGFKGEPYVEEDIPNPLSVYGLSKYAGEIVVRNYCKTWVIIRTTGLYGIAGSSGKGGNFVETMIRLAKEGKKIRVVSDQVMTPTFTRDLAARVHEIIRKDLWGIFHITNKGSCSWYDFARQIFSYCGLDADLGPTTTVEFGSKAKRPAYSVLDGKKLRESGSGLLRDWKDALQEYLRDKGYIK